jgi:hypothetical protein
MVTEKPGRQTDGLGEFSGKHPIVRGSGADRLKIGSLSSGCSRRQPGRSAQRFVRTWLKRLRIGKVSKHVKIKDLKNVNEEALRYYIKQAVELDAI